jgi:hypothetical protein
LAAKPPVAPAVLKGSVQEPHRVQVPLRQDDDEVLSAGRLSFWAEAKSPHASAKVRTDRAGLIGRRNPFSPVYAGLID